MKGKIINLIKPTKLSKKLSKKRKKIFLYILYIFGFFLVLIGILIAVYWSPTQKLIIDSKAGKDSFLKAEELLLKQDFSGAKIILENSITNFKSSKNSFKQFLWLKHIPWVGTQIIAIDNLFSVGISTGQSIKEVSDIASSIVAPFSKNEEISLVTLTEEETQQLLKNIYNAKPKLEEAKVSMDQAVSFINKIPTHGVIKKINDIILPLKEQVPKLQLGLDQAISMSQILPLVVGYPNQKTYLFLLENNAELAPSGGFIGTYGILKIKNGNIISFATDNVYNLDEPAEAWLDIEAPWPVTRYNNAPKVFLRGASWSPDFPTTGEKTQWFYKEERGPEKNIDGTIAITPTFIESLLSITGEVKVNNLTFTSENFTEVLQDQVERGFLRQGTQLSERKEIIGVLSDKILDDILSLPKSRWPELWKVIQQNVEQKQILLYANDEYTQSMILKENWGGAIKDVDHDYVTVIDANLASLKSDPFVKRTLSYQVRRDKENLIADLYFTYKNEGTITWKTTRYRTYVRTYVPAGSTLILSEGAMIDCKIDKEGSVETTEELNKTVFGAFVCTEPGESKTIHYKYKLPNRITRQLLNENKYRLLIQKQAGAANYDLNLEFKLKKKPKNIKTENDDIDIELSDDIVINSILSQDRLINLEY